MDAKTSQMLLDIFKSELNDLHQSLIQGLLSLEKASTPNELEHLFSELFRFSHNMKGAAQSASVKPIALMAHRLEDLFSKWREHHYRPRPEEISACMQVTDNILQTLDLYCKGQAIDIDSAFAPLQDKKFVIDRIADDSNLTHIKLPIHRIEKANAKAGEFSYYEWRFENWFKDLSQIAHALNHIETDNPSDLSLVKKMNLLTHEGGHFLEEFSRSVHVLQEELTALRMLPISMILIPLNRTVRDVATTLGKSVELIIEGGETELDKNILDAIKDPLQHLVRNAIDHGIEENEIRKKLNKPIPALLRIRIWNVAQKIKLEISDDGQGISLENIKQHALEKRLYSQEELAAKNDNELLELIFSSGFSLKEKISEISGRGVGLDVVKNNIYKIKGSINIHSILGKGTTFTLTLPVTLTTTRGVFFKVNEHIYMLPTLAIVGIYEINLQALKKADNQYLFVLDNKTIRVKSAALLLGMEQGKKTKKSDHYGLVIMHDSKKIMLLVDSIIDEHSAVVKPLPFPYSKLTHFVGVTLTQESGIVLVLDVARMIERSLSSPDENYEQEVSDPPFLSRKKKVLVVDDSLTGRTLSVNALEANGYEAVSAVNGKKGWELLQKEAFDCVITDILMPEMDGFELTRLIRNTPKYKHIPVIIVSSLGFEKDKQQGLDAGADAFVVKSEFDSHTIIQMMESLI